MSTTLVIAEKPSLGKDIAAALPGGNATTKDGCIYKGNYIVTWVFGHMLSLKEPEDYNEDYKEWNLRQLPIYFEPWDVKIGIDAKKAPGQISKAARVKQIGTLLKQADMVIHAGDPDEEGQLLVDELLRWFHYKGPVKRLDTGNTTKEALQKALRHMQDNKTRETEGWSAYARSVADMMVGVNMSRYFSLNNPATLTIGRVQTPTLGLVVNRDAIIENHVKTMFYEMFANTEIQGKQIECKFVPDKNNPNLTDGKMLNRAVLEEKQPSLNHRTLSNIQITKTSLKENPPLPFNLVKLQSYCGSHWGYSPSDVMAITQSLRENHKAITYNRSDCQYLSDEHFKEAPDVLAAVTANLSYNPAFFDSSIKSKCFNSANITAHFAIIPTTTKVDLSRLSEQEKNVYVAIAHRYLAQFMPPAEKEKTNLMVDLGNGESLQAVSTVITKPGYLTLLKETKKKEEENHTLSSLPKGTYSGTILSTDIREKETKPPARYTKSSLNEDMTRIAKYVDDPEIKELLLAKDKEKKGENGSIGTSATRSTIIDNLIRRGFLAEKGRTVISTPLGRELYRILPDEIKKADLTARWWAIQEDIRTGKADYTALTKQVLETVTNIIHTKYPTINTELLPAGTKGAAPEVIGKCPKCGNPVEGKPKGFFCTNKDCNFALWPTMKYFDNTLKITKTKAKALLAGKHATFSLKSKSGKTYDGYLKMKINGQYVNFEPDGFPLKRKK